MDFRQISPEFIMENSIKNKKFDKSGEIIRNSKDIIYMTHTLPCRIMF